MWNAIKDYAELVWIICVVIALSLVMLAYTWWTGKPVILDEDT